MKRMDKLIKPLAISFLILPGVAFLFYLNYEHKLLSTGTLKCDGYVSFNTIYDGTPVTFNLLQDFNLNTKNESTIIFHGVRIENNHETRIERKVVTSIAKLTDEETIVMTVKRIEKSLNDNADDLAFSHFMSDFGSINNTIRLDIVPLNRNTYLIGNSTAFNFTCVAY